MVFNEITHGIYLFRNLHIDEAYDTGMGQSANEYQFAEVFVFRDDYASFLSCRRHQRFVGSAWVYLNSR